jgi:DNA-binding MarR family transcriptional regulator
MSHELASIDKKAGTLQVLVALDSGGETRMTDLCRSIRLERGTVARAVAVLERLGLVIRTHEREFPFVRPVFLSPLGRRVIQAPITEWSSILFEAQVTGALSVHVALPRPRSGTMMIRQPHSALHPALPDSARLNLLGLGSSQRRSSESRPKGTKLVLQKKA